MEFNGCSSALLIGLKPSESSRQPSRHKIKDAAHSRGTCVFLLGCVGRAGAGAGEGWRSAREAGEEVPETGGEGGEKGRGAAKGKAGGETNVGGKAVVERAVRPVQVRNQALVVHARKHRVQKHQQPYREDARAEEVGHRW